LQIAHHPEETQTGAPVDLSTLALDTAGFPTHDFYKLTDVEVPSASGFRANGTNTVTFSMLPFGLGWRSGEFSKKNSLLVSGYTVFWAWFCV